MRDASSAVVRFAPAPGYYLYKEKLAFRADGSGGAAVAGVALPAAEVKQDPTFGSTYVYHEPFEAVIELSGGGGGPHHSCGRLSGLRRAGALLCTHDEDLRAGFCGSFGDAAAGGGARTAPSPRTAASP